MDGGRRIVPPVSAPPKIGPLSSLPPIWLNLLDLGTGGWQEDERMMLSTPLAPNSRHHSTIFLRADSSAASRDRSTCAPTASRGRRDFAWRLGRSPHHAQNQKARASG